MNRFIFGKSLELDAGEMSAGDLTEAMPEDEVEVVVPEVRLPDEDFFLLPIVVFAFAFSLLEVTEITVVAEVVLLAVVEVGTLGVLTGNMGEFVRDREPKNRNGFSGEDATPAAEAEAAPDPDAAAPEAGTGCGDDEEEV